jgi:site-specific DNA-cytosine methylase
MNQALQLEVLIDLFLKLTKCILAMLHQLYPLITIEKSYLQTFPPNFVFEGSKTDLEQMIGNAVPVKLAEYVARCIVQ